MGRRSRIVGALVLIISSIACLSLSGGSAMAAREGQAAERRSNQPDLSRARRDCVKRQNASKAKRRPCQKPKQRRREPLVVTPAPAGSTDLAAPAAPPAQNPSPEPPNFPPEPVPEPNKDRPKTTEELPPPVTRDCELVEGDCSIYSDKFWELLAKYKRFEIGVGVYPYHPACMEAWEEGKSIACATVLVHLRPDGSLGMTP